MKKKNLTVAIITKNEEDRLPATLQSIHDIASEIVLVDSGSTDGTIEVAKKFHAKIYYHQWEGFSAQKNYLLSKCSCQWVLFLDADEVITDKLKDEISSVIDSNQDIGYEINRKTFYLGKLLNHAWQPNYRLRLVKTKCSPRWIGERVHEELIVNCPRKKLSSYLIHYSYRDIRDHFNKTIQYAYLSSQDYLEKGKHSSLIKILFKPTFAFFKNYFLKLAFLDGYQGLISSMSSSFYVFLKYSMLYNLQRK